MTKSNLTLTIFSLVVLTVFLTGCDLVPLHMRNQPKYQALEESQFFADGMAARSIPAHTIPRGEWGAAMLNESFYTGKIGDEFVNTIPIPVTDALMARGQERYNIYCAPCHDRAGYGNGIIAQRGFPPPPSFHIERLREQPDGYFYDVITNGFGRMYNYKARLDPQDRWAIVAYLRALQLSQNTPVEELPETEKSKLE
ncbi:MAG: cytochrome c [Anaerolineae bacterium]|nr:cytochrome c [Anaerolineae bacterium]